MRNGRLSASSVAMTTPMAGPAGGGEGGRALDGDVAEGGGGGGGGPEPVGGHLPRAGAGIDEEEGVGRAEVVPPPVPRRGHQPPERGPALDAGEEVAAGPPRPA